MLIERQVVIAGEETLKIAIASSGLGHVARGIETWARDTALALAELGGGGKGGESVEVTLFQSRNARARAGMQNAECRMQNEELNTRPEGGQHTSDPSAPPATQVAAGLRIVGLPCLRRGDRLARTLARGAPGFLWRLGFKSAYGWEQFTFWISLWPRLRAGRFDILHVQDPMLAYWCRVFRRFGWIRTKEILAHGTEESTAFISAFEYVQHLAPWHLEQSLRERQGR